MKNLQDIAEFQSVRFSPVLPEDCQVNPQVYGAELAFWLCIELAKHDVATSYPNAEDWGWYIEYITKEGAEFAVHCGNIGGDKDYWALALRRYGRKLFGWGKPSYSDAMPLITAIYKILCAEDSIVDLKWLYESDNAI